MRKLQLQEHIDFGERQRTTLESFETMMSLRDVRMVLALSSGAVIELVQAGRLPAYKLGGEPIESHELGEETTGLRFLPSDVEHLIYNSQV